MSSRTHSTMLAVQSPLQSTVHSVLVAASVLLMLTWLTTWAFGLGQAVVLATSLIIVLVGLSAVGLQLAMGHKSAAPALRQGAATPAKADEHAHLHGKRWSLDVFSNIDAQRFAAVCETWFSWAGFDTRYESHRNHEGVDIWLHASRLPGPVAIVRCKHVLDKQVGLQEMRDFQGVVSSCKSAHGTFTTTSTYTPEALQYARENGIEVVDGRALLRRILTRTRQSQQALLAVAYSGR